MNIRASSEKNRELAATSSLYPTPYGIVQPEEGEWMVLRVRAGEVESPLIKVRSSSTGTDSPPLQEHRLGAIYPPGEYPSDTDILPEIRELMGPATEVFGLFSLPVVRPFGIPNTVRAEELLEFSASATTPRFTPIEDPAIIERLEQVEHILSQVVTEAKEEQYPIPSKDMLKETERLVRWIVKQCANEYDVYPTEEKQVVVEVYGGFGRRLSLTFDEGGGALCIVIVDLLARRAIYEDSTKMLPDGFLRDAIRDIGERYSVGTTGVFLGQYDD